ncbi:MAG: class IV adenylate cyclase [Candidatus Paceibacterota bacterium]|jgi:predicted adenylyl cyclase CyaB
MYEVEVKAHLRKREEVIKKLKDFGCKFGEELHQVDYIFIPKGVLFPPPLSVPVLRVRKQNDKYLFTLKLSQTGRQDCIERELEILNGNKMIEIMELLYYKKVAVVDKKRIKTKYKNMEIVLDKVKSLGEFVEVEKIVTNKNHEDRKKIQKDLCNFLETLGILKKDHLVNGKYDIMLFKKNKKK